MESISNRPWEMEPDVLEWQDEETGYWCRIKRQSLGHLCGYVQVPMELAAADYESFDVHWGVTYAGCGHPDVVGSPKDKFWIGFDCAHAGDYVPFAVGDRFCTPNEEYRTIGYVRLHVEKLAKQAKKICDSKERRKSSAPYKTRSSYKTTLRVGVWLENFVPEALSIGVQNTPMLNSNCWVTIGELEVDLVKLGFDIPTSEELAHMKELHSQAEKEQRRADLLKRIAALDSLPTDAYEQTDSFKKS